MGCRGVTQVIFAWLYYGTAVFFLLVVPYFVYEKNGSQTAALLSFFVVLLISLQYYQALRKLIWSSL